MYYYFPCPKCGHSISDWESGNDQSYYAEGKLMQLVKDHYAHDHMPQELLLTDSELDYAIKTGMKTSDTKPIV